MLKALQACSYCFYYRLKIGFFCLKPNYIFRKKRNLKIDLITFQPLLPVGLRKNRRAFSCLSDQVRQFQHFIAWFSIYISFAAVDRLQTYASSSFAGLCFECFLLENGVFIRMINLIFYAIFKKNQKWCETRRRLSLFEVRFLSVKGLPLRYSKIGFTFYQIRLPTILKHRH